MLKMGISNRSRVGSIGLALTMAVVALSNYYACAQDFVSLGSEAPTVEKKPSRWSSGIKQIFGTAYEAYDTQNHYSNDSATAPLSKVWFTGAQGVLTEVYWPSIDTPQVRDSQFLVSDGKTFLFEERKDALSKIEWLQMGVPAFKITNRDAEGRFEIEKIIFSDPDRNVVIQRIKITRYRAGLKFYVLHNPSVGSTPLGNSALASLNRSPGMGLFAWQGTQAQALVSTLPFSAVSAGFADASDGWTDLHADFTFDNRYESALNGDVVLTGELNIAPEIGQTEFDLVLGFGNDINEAYRVAQASIQGGIQTNLEKYSAQWLQYQNGIRNLGSLSFDQGKLFRASIAIMKSMEDKTFEGAFVASPTVPWGLNTLDWNVELRPGESRNKLVTGYHLVWPRDLFQMATSFMAVDDYNSAIASLNYLKAIQYGPKDLPDWNFGSGRKHSRNGSFPQNVWINGESAWGMLQMDEVSVPVILTYRLLKAKKINLAEYWNMVQRASDFITEFGPWSPQERWEEHSGVSPSTVAAEITALRCASALAQEMGDLGRAEYYKKVANDWDHKPNDNLDTWLYTTTGGIGNGQYYERIEASATSDQAWNPNDNSEIKLHNLGGVHREKDIIDGGFLELVRYGIRDALNPRILNTIAAYDEKIRVNVPGRGPSFFRYLYDGYNYDEESGRQTAGMLWPFLTGERGHYELAKSLELRQNPGEISRSVNPYIQSMENFATASLMLPEQVWDAGPHAGESTGSATPLGWTHGEYIKLLRSRSDQAVFDQLKL